MWWFIQVLEQGWEKWGFSKHLLILGRCCAVYLCIIHFPGFAASNQIPQQAGNLTLFLQKVHFIQISCSCCRDAAELSAFRSPQQFCWCSSGLNPMRVSSVYSQARTPRLQLPFHIRFDDPRGMLVMCAPNLSCLLAHSSSCWKKGLLGWAVVAKRDRWQAVPQL